MASGGLSFVTPPRVKESSPSFALDSSFKSKGLPNDHNRHNSISYAMKSRSEVKTLNEWSTEWQTTANKRCFTVSYSKSHLERKKSDGNHRKRRYSCGTSSDQKFMNQKRRKDRIVLPTKFLLGGDITDPLNLSSLANGANQVTPQSSPLPTPKHKTHVEVLIPANINDPLNLNSNEDIDESSLISPKMKNKSRKRKRKRTDSETTAEPEPEASVAVVNDPIPSEPKKIEILSKPQKLRFNENLKTIDKIVSPVIPQGMGSKHRRFGDTSKATVESEVLVPNNETKVKHKKFNKNKTKSKSNFREKDQIFRFGNYNRYYGYRNAIGFDSRLESFKKEWFENKDVLDIGCNVGHITLAIAKNFEPKKIIGLDIDSSLIRMANKNVRHYITSSVLQTQDFPISLPLFHGPLASTVTLSSTVDKMSSFPKNVCFIAGNYINDTDDNTSCVQKQQFDAILCLSLTKWIHLNWGDSGVKTLFTRIFSQLRPGGKLVLEAQPWCTYSRKKKINETTLKNFNEIKFRPEQFNEYLLSREVGFSQSELIGTPTNPSKGFRRPIYVFTKSGLFVEKE